MNSISARRIQQHYPDYEPETVFIGALTLYRLHIKARVLVQAQLSTFGSFVLQAIESGVDTPREIAWLLGVEERDIAKGPGAELLEAGSITHGGVSSEGTRKLVLTELGRKQMKEGLLRTPRQRVLRVHYNPLTQLVEPLRSDAVAGKDIQDRSLYVLPYVGREPRLAELRAVEVRDAVLGMSKRGERFDIVSMLSFEKSYAEYLSDVEVFMLRHRQAGNQRVVAAYRGQILPEVSKALQSLHEAGKPIAPADAQDLRPLADSSALATDVLPPTIAGPAAELLDRNRRVEELKEKRSATQTARERDEFERLYKDEVAKRDELQRSLRTAVEYIYDEQHRAFLERALNEAQKEIIIISPWMNRAAMNNHICGLIGKALIRGVRIRIGYGFIHERTPEDVDRQRRSASKVIEQLSSYRRGLPEGQLQIIRVREATHEKILISDTTFGVTTSFNWLSYRGDRDSQFRRETGTVVYLPESVAQLAERAADALEGGQRS